jgi:hypothetical protein
MIARTALSSIGRRVSPIAGSPIRHHATAIAGRSAATARGGCDRTRWADRPNNRSIECPRIASCTTYSSVDCSERTADFSRASPSGTDQHRLVLTGEDSRWRLESSASSEGGFRLDERTFGLTYRPIRLRVRAHIEARRAGFLDRHSASGSRIGHIYTRTTAICR